MSSGVIRSPSIFLSFAARSALLRYAPSVVLSAAALACGSEGSGGEGVPQFQMPVSANGANPAVPGPPEAMLPAPTGTEPTAPTASEGGLAAAPLDPAMPASTTPGTPAPMMPPAMALPRLPGVIVIDPAGALCAPLCQSVLNVSAEPDGDDWSSENESSCVIPETETARFNDPCFTGDPLPGAEPLPGILVGDGLSAVCRPLCNLATVGTSAEAPDWAFERNTSCVLPGTATANAAARTCTFGGPVAPELVPPALTGTKRAPGFFVQDGRLLDAYGEDFVIRGVNNPHVWFDTSAQYRAFDALDAIASYGTNTIRVAWTTEAPVALLREVMHRVVELEMVPMVELHDVTGNGSRERLVDMAEHYASPDMRDLMLDFREYALINIANEWSGNDYAGAYGEAIALLRANGLDHTLVIDANGFAQNGQAILDNAGALTNADPQRNLLFSVHMYELFGNAGAVDALLNAADAAGIALIVGEFGHQHNGQDVAWERILTRTNELGLGYIPWSWFGNDASTAQLDMAVAPNWSLTGWGQDVMMRAPGNIRSTSRRASIFE